MAGGEGKGRPAGPVAQALPEPADPQVRFWVIFNNQFRPMPVVTAPNWLAVIQRSPDTATRASTCTAVRHLCRWPR